jgi:hypothetical protein
LADRRKDPEKSVNGNIEGKRKFIFLNGRRNKVPGIGGGD